MILRDLLKTIELNTCIDLRYHAPKKINTVYKNLKKYLPADIYISYGDSEVLSVAVFSDVMEVEIG